MTVRALESVPAGLRDELRREIDKARRVQVTGQPAPVDRQARAAEIHEQAQRILTSDRYQRLLGECQHTSRDIDAELHAALICARLDSLEQARKDS